MRGRAEVARYMFAISGTPYTDDRVTDWGSFKSKTPYGQMPVLAVGDAVIPQSGAIERFLARRLGFYGSTDIENALIEAAAEQIRDIALAYWPIMKDDTKATEWFSGGFLALLGGLEKDYTRSGTHFVVGKKITYAEVLLYALLNDSTGLLANRKEELAKALKTVPKVSAAIENTAKNEGLQKWIKERPVTER